jgi:Undecaprenyl-phosphate galactose phosphotransferase WbaP
MTTESLIVHTGSDLVRHNAGSRSTRLNFMARPWMVGVLFICDVCALALALGIAAAIVLGFKRDLSNYNELVGILLIAFGFSFWRYGLYPATGQGYAEELRRIVEAASIAFLIAVAYTFLVKNSVAYSRLTLTVAWALALALVPLLRYLAVHTLCTMGIWGEPVAIIGDLDKALPLAGYLTRKPHCGIRPIAVLRKENCRSAFSDRYPCLSLEEIHTIADGLHLHTALVVINDLNHIDIAVDKYRSIFPRVVLIKHQLGSWGLNSLEPLDFGDVLGLQVRNNLLNPWSQYFKRAIDLAAAVLGFVVISPLLLLIVLAIKLDSPGSLFYRNRCVGRRGRQFDVLKFRTMYTDANQKLEAVLAANPDVQEEWDRYHKLKNDPRVTRVGRWLRKFSLDELPQLWSILVGEMSLVGPRPMKEWETVDYGETIKDFYRVTPGMTGLWQVSGRNQTTFIRRAQLDCEYIQKWSLWLDVYILVMTVKVVLLREGAY